MGYIAFDSMRHYYICCRNASAEWWGLAIDDPAKVKTGGMRKFFSRGK